MRVVLFSNSCVFRFAQEKVPSRFSIFLLAPLAFNSSCYQSSCSFDINKLLRLKKKPSNTCTKWCKRKVVWPNVIYWVQIGWQPACGTNTCNTFKCKGEKKLCFSLKILWRLIRIAFTLRNQTKSGKEQFVEQARRRKCHKLWLWITSRLNLSGKIYPLPSCVLSC